MGRTAPRQQKGVINSLWNDLRAVVWVPEVTRVVGLCPTQAQNRTMVPGQCLWSGAPVQSGVWTATSAFPPKLVDSGVSVELPYNALQGEPGRSFGSRGDGLSKSSFRSFASQG